MLATEGGEDDPVAATATAVESASSLIAAAAEDGVESSDAAADESGPLQKLWDSSCSFLAAVFDYDDGGSSRRKRLGADSSSGGLDYALYDCIMDKGLIADMLRPSEQDEDDNEVEYGDDNVQRGREDVARLLHEATRRIRDNGIYVANTPPMSSETKEYLRMLGKVLGLQWEFDLDGISDGRLSVSVARKYGRCPETLGELGIIPLE